MKKTQTTASPTAAANAGTDPSAKHSEPIMKSTAIHQPRRCGAHHGTAADCSGSGRVDQRRGPCGGATR